MEDDPRISTSHILRSAEFKKKRQAKFIIKNNKQIQHVIESEIEHAREELRETFKATHKTGSDRWLLLITSSHMVIGQPSLETQNQGKIYKYSKLPVPPHLNF